MARQKVHGQINQWHIIMIISTYIQKNPAKVCTDSFVSVNLHPRHSLSFSDWIKKIAPSVKTGETAYFRNPEGSYYNYMPYVWKNMTVIKRRELIYVIDFFTADTSHGKSPLTKRNVCLSLVLFPLTKSPR